jgi:hypothetical protein
VIAGRGAKNTSNFPYQVTSLYDADMEWYHLKLFGTVGIITLAILLGAFVWENWFDTTWHGLRAPVTFTQIFIEWIVFMLIFAFLSLLLHEILYRACSVC